MADVRVTCIRKPHPQSPHEHITHIGTGQQLWPREEVIRWIDQQDHTFFTQDSSGKRADVGVVREDGKAPYLRTYADGKWNNNLLSLPQCP